MRQSTSTLTVETLGFVATFMSDVSSFYCRRIVASILPNWKAEADQEQEICKSWPELLGHPRQHDVSRYSAYDGQVVKPKQVVPVPRKRRLHQSSSRSNLPNTTKQGNGEPVSPDKAGDREYRMLMEVVRASNIPRLPIPEIEGVPQDVIESIIVFNKRCKLCKNCIKDKGHRMLPCLSLEAVLEWENQLGGVDGETVAAIASKLNQLTEGHGMRKGKGIRCGSCKKCRARRQIDMCLTTVAIRDGWLPDRLKPAAAIEIPKRKQALGGLADPFAPKPSGIQILKQNFFASGNNMNARLEDDPNEISEFERWGLTNVPYHERLTVKDMNARQRKREKFFRWKCDYMSGKDGKCCGKMNREGAMHCTSCKAPRWFGDVGQLQARVDNIMDRGILVGYDFETIVEHLKSTISSEYGSGGILHDGRVSSQAIHEALENYYAARNQQSGLRGPIMDNDVIETGRIIKDSIFGKAMQDFEDSLGNFVRERAAMKDPTIPIDDVVVGTQNGSQEVILVEGNVKSCINNVLEDIKYILSVQRQHADVNGKLDNLKARLLDWGREPEWFEGLQNAWKCPRARKQMACIVLNSYPFTITSMFAHFIHCSIRKKRGLPTNSTACHSCAVDHHVHLPIWRAHPALIKLSDRIHDITPRVLDEESFSLNRNSLETVDQMLRYPLYNLVEQTLNHASMHEATERIPQRLRPSPLERFIEYVFVMYLCVSRSTIMNHPFDCILGQPRSPNSLLCLYQAPYGMGSKTWLIQIKYPYLSVFQMARQVWQHSCLRYLDRKSIRNFWPSTLNRIFMEEHSDLTRNTCHSLLRHLKKLRG